jgi:mannose-6-phosphate isomerase-like protein (cupin superfamily)
VSDYNVLRADEAPDFTGDEPGAFLGYGRPMGAGQVAFNVRELEPGQTHMPPGGDPTGGHAHVTIEEIYFVLEGEITVKLGEDVITLGPRDAVVIPPGTTRGVRNLGDVPAAFAMVSVKVEDQMKEANFVEGFWPAS